MLILPFLSHSSLTPLHASSLLNAFLSNNSFLCQRRPVNGLFIRPFLVPTPLNASLTGYPATCFPATDLRTHGDLLAVCCQPLQPSVLVNLTELSHYGRGQNDMTTVVDVGRN